MAARFTCVRSSFLSEVECVVAIVWLHYFFFNHLLMHTWVALPLGYCEWCCYKRECINTSSDPAVTSFGCTPRSGIAGSHSSSILIFDESPYCFPLWFHHFTIPSTVHKGFGFQVICFYLALIWWLMMLCSCSCFWPFRFQFLLGGCSSPLPTFLTDCQRVFLYIQDFNSL